MANYAKIRYNVKAVETPMDLSGSIVYRFSFLFDGYFINTTSSNDNINRPTSTPPQFGKGDGYFDTFYQNLSGVINSYYILGNGRRFKVTAGSSGRNNGYIEFEATEYGHAFYPYPQYSLPNLEPGIVTLEVLPVEYKLLDVTAMQVDSPIVGDRQTRCVYRISAENFTAPSHAVTLPSNSYELPFTAGLFYNLEFDRLHSRPTIQLRDANNVVSVNTLRLPVVQRWTIANVITTENTATIVTGTYPDYDIATTILYSVDSSPYQSSSFFSDLSVGNHQAEILDNLGGRWYYNFTIISNEDKPLPFIDISDVNALQFRDQSQSGNYKSLLAKQKYINVEQKCFVQRFDSTVITTQIRSSYETITPRVNGEDKAITKVVANISQLDWRDCQFADGGVGKTLVYFQSGQVYDPANGDVIGSYNNTTPIGISIEDWREIGDIVTFTFGVFKVVEIIRSNEVGGMCLKIETPYQNFIPEICKTKYNKEEWDVWEFSFDTGLLNADETNTVEITFEDTDYPTKIWESEPFVRVSDASELIKLSVFGDQNISDIVPTDTIHSIWLQAQFFDYEMSTEMDAFEDDKMNAVTVKRSLMRNIYLKTHAIPEYLAHKIGLYMLFDNVLLDDIAFEPVDVAKTSSFVDKQNPFYTLVQKFRPLNSAQSNISTSEVVSRVLGASSSTVLGA